MDSAGRIIAAWKDGRGIVSPEAVAVAAWARAVGRNVAQQTRAVKLIDSTLIIEVEDELWQRNLRSLRYQILRNLEKAIGPEIVQDLQFKVMPLRREPQRAAQKELSGAGRDEADAIADPGMRRVYKAARRRESA